MADITVRLMWYRLCESSQHLGVVWEGLDFLTNAGGTVINYIFLCWLFIGLLTILLVSIIQNVEKRQKAKREEAVNRTGSVCERCQSRTVKDIRKSPVTLSPPSTTKHKKAKEEWLNNLLRWLNVNETQWKTPIIENLLTTLTEESRTIGGDLFVTFEALLPVGDAPLLEITRSEKSSFHENKLVLHGEVQFSGLQLSLTASDNSVSIHSNLLLIIHLLRIRVEIDVEDSTDFVSLLIRAGEIITCDIQLCPYHQGVDCITDERKLTQHVTSIFTHISLPVNIAIKSGADGEGCSPPPPHKVLTASSSLNTARPPKPPRSMDDKRLMIKLIKATKLNRRNLVTLDAYCVIEVDKPTQTHSTSVVKNTVNPYWDEHFLFDLGNDTKTVNFRVYGHSKELEGARNCLGESRVDLEKLRANHGVRMVLPLETRPDMSEPVSGSVTMEAFFVDSAEFEPNTTSSEVDDVFAQSVEPLVMSDADLESPVSEQPMNGDSRLSSLSLTDSTTKIIKTSTYVQKDRLSYDGSGKDGSLPGVEKAETVENITASEAHSVTEKLQDSPLGIDIADAEVITVYPNQSVTEVVMKELNERASRPRDAGGRKTSTIIITAASRSDDSSGGTPSTWDISQQQSPKFDPAPPPTGMEGGQEPQQPVQPQRQLDVPKISEPPPSGERKSRLSGLKKRFTRTKDKKPRSHSIERSSGLDEHRYLEPPHNTSLGTSKSDVTLGLPSSKKKFGGSLRRLFGLRKRSSSASSRQKQTARDQRLSPTSSQTYEDRLSVEGDSRVPHHGSRSSFERDMTPPHHRMLSPSAGGYHDYGANSETERPSRSETIDLDGRYTGDHHYPREHLYPDEAPTYAGRRHYSLPSQQRELSQISY